MAEDNLTLKDIKGKFTCQYWSYCNSYCLTGNPGGGKNWDDWYADLMGWM
jgi:hypothetical protein